MLLKPKSFLSLFHDGVYTVSNLLSVSRVLLIPVFYYFSSYYAYHPSQSDYLYYSVFTLATAVMTDYLDGLIARHMGEQSVLGRYLDPICDKITTIIAMILIVFYFAFPLWLLIIYIIREIYTFYMGAFLYFKRGIQGRPNWWGKFGVGIVAIDVFWHMYLPYWQTIHHKEDWTLHPEISSYILLIVLTAGVVSYTVRYWNIVFHPESIKAEKDIKKSGKHFHVVD